MHAAAASTSETPSEAVTGSVDSVSHTRHDPRTMWAQRSIAERLRILKVARHRMAAMTERFTSAISPELARTEADTLVAEVLPLLAAARFLEQQAENVLKIRRLGRRGLPWWLHGVHSEVRRVPFGTVLIIGPANYPLFLPGVQALQGLAAGNAVIWKPGRGGGAVAHLFAHAAYDAGLPHELLQVTDESVEAVEHVLTEGVDKVFFTGSAATGRILLKRLAETLTPCVAELSGCDAMIVLPSAELSGVVQALTFGMRLNGSATCMAPRRVLLVNASSDRRAQFSEMLQTAFKTVGDVVVPEAVRSQVQSLLDEARASGATVLGNAGTKRIQPLIVLNATPQMQITQADVFAPVVSVIDVQEDAGVLAVQAACPFGLTASIFGNERDARRLAARLTVGTVLINDVIVATADPRVPFGGRRQSGFGVSRGAEGLLEMTAIKTVSVRRGTSKRQYEATGKLHERLFTGAILAAHAGRWKDRLLGVRDLIAAGKRMKGK